MVQRAPEKETPNTQGEQEKSLAFSLSALRPQRPGNVMAKAAASTKVANNRKLLWEQGAFLSTQWSYGGRGSKPFTASSTLPSQHGGTVTGVAS